MLTINEESGRREWTEEEKAEARKKYRQEEYDRYYSMMLTWMRSALKAHEMFSDAFPNDFGGSREAFNAAVAALNQEGYQFTSRAYDTVGSRGSSMLSIRVFPSFNEVDNAQFVQDLIIQLQDMSLGDWARPQQEKFIKLAQSMIEMCKKASRKKGKAVRK